MKLTTIPIQHYIKKTLILLTTDQKKGNKNEKKNKISAYYDFSLVKVWGTLVVDDFHLFVK